MMPISLETYVTKMQAQFKRAQMPGASPRAIFAALPTEEDAQELGVPLQELSKYVDVNDPHVAALIQRSHVEIARESLRHFEQVAYAQPLNIADLKDSLEGVVAHLEAANCGIETIGGNAQNVNKTIANLQLEHPYVKALFYLSGKAGRLSSESATSMLRMM